MSLRHGKVVKVIYDAIIDCKNQKKGIVDIYREHNKDIWWDKKITTIPPLKHSKPYILYWNNTFSIVVGLDANMTKNTNLKHGVRGSYHLS